MRTSCTDFDVEFFYKQVAKDRQINLGLEKTYSRGFTPITLINPNNMSTYSFVCVHIVSIKSKNKNVKIRVFFFDVR